MLRSAGIAATVAVLACLPATGQAATPTPLTASAKPPIGNSCLIGTWLDKKNTQEVLFHHHVVNMTGAGADVDHIHASGIDRNDWSSSAPLNGTVDDSPLKEVVRGINKLRLSPGSDASSLAVTELGWSAGSTTTFTYQGRTTTRKNQDTGSGSAYYQCSATKLTWLSQSGDVLGHERRLSFKP